METVTVPSSVYIDGQWFAATWLAEVVDDDSGELVLTATVDGSAPRVTALKLQMETVRDLRQAAGFDGPSPSQRTEAAEADLRYWQESVRFAVDMLRRGRSGGQLHRAANDAESYLRQLLEMQAATDEIADLGPLERQCNGVRLAELERMIGSLHEHQVLDARQMHKLANRIDDLEHAAAPAVAMRAWEDKIERRLSALESWHKTVENTARLQLPGVGQMLDQYDPERDAAPVTYWDMKLLDMIEKVNERLAGEGS